MRTAILLLTLLATSRNTANLQPRTLIVFKSGLAWIEHRGDVALANGWGAIPTAPDAVLGTLSITSDAASIDEIRTLGRSVDPKVRETSFDALLVRSAGRMVTVRIGDRDVSGRLISSAPEAILLESGGKTTAISRGQITSATFDGELAVAPDVTPSLRFHTTAKTATVPVRLSYLRPEIGWFPDYSIILDGHGRAALTMRATLVDDSEDLRDTDVFFAVGVPNFTSHSIESPLSGRQSLAELLSALGTGSFVVSAAMINANTANYVRPGTGGSFDFGATTTPGTEGERGEDFFFYSRKGITLAKGERAAFPLLEASVKYTDVYTIDIPREQEDKASLADKVWHSVRLQNPTELPWTTAPALVFANGRPVAQETLRYTPARGETTLQLTVANSIVVDRHESEVTRKREAVERFGSRWEIATIEGTIELRNFRKEAVVVAVTKEIEGEATASPGLRVTRVAMQPRAANPIEQLQWDVTVPAGGTKSISYRYQVLVRG